MQQFVAIVNPHNIWTNHRKDMLAVLDTPGLTGVDVRWSLSGEHDATRRNIAALQLVRAARDRELEIRMHGWVGHPDAINADVAYGQAQQAAQICTGEGVNAWGINAEKDVWRHGRDKALAFLDAYLDKFYDRGRQTHAAYLGFVFPPLFYGKDCTIPDEHKRRYWQCWQMIYQINPEAVRNRIALGEREWPEHVRNIYAGCGRIDDKGIVQGAWSTWLHQRDRVQSLTWYVGNGRAHEQLTIGNKQHPPLTVAIPTLAGIDVG
jgi:hypothetical protein